MILRRFLLSIVLISILSLSSCKDSEESTQFTTTSYILPISDSPGITSSFGEYRLNKFHMGIDFSTNYEVGKPVKVINDGYIWRIKQHRIGYGKVIYVKHPDETMSVYAHLDRFSNSFYLNLELRMKRRIETTGMKYGHQITFSPFEFPVKKGQVIGYSGKSGAGGPHLHFEIRDMENIPFLPVPDIIELNDSIPPTFTKLYILPLTRESQVEGLHSGSKFTVNKGLGDEYNLNPETIRIKGKVGIIIGAYDRAGLNNKLGVKSVQLKVNDTVEYSLDFSKISYINYSHGGMVFYNAVSIPGEGYHRLFSENDTSLNIIKSNTGSGVISCNPGEEKIVNIQIRDMNDNLSELEFKVMGIEDEITPPADLIKGNFHTKIMTSYADIYYKNNGRIIEFNFLNIKKNEQVYFYVYEKGKKKPVFKKILKLEKGKVNSFSLALPKLGVGDYTLKVFSIGKKRVKKGKKYITQKFNHYHLVREFMVFDPAEEIGEDRIKLEGFNSLCNTPERIMVEVEELPGGYTPRGCIQISPGFKIGPDDLIFSGRLKIKMKFDPKISEPEQLGIYALRNGKFKYIGDPRLTVGNELYGEFPYLTQFIILRDLHAPVITKEIKFEEAKNRLIFLVKDNASGIDYENIKITWDNQPYDFDFEPDEGEIYVEFMQKPGSGIYTFSAVIPDNSTNKLTYTKKIKF